MLFNLHTQEWDDEMLGMLNFPRAVLPQVVDTAQVIGNLRPEIPGAAPFPWRPWRATSMPRCSGRRALSRAWWKNTYGTGCFMLMNTGEVPVESQNGLLTTMAWRLDGKPTFALEGSVFMGGATVQWLRDEMKLIKTAAESEQIAESVPDTAGVFLVPAFTGLGAPYWDMYSRGTIVGHDPRHGAGRTSCARRWRPSATRAATFSAPWWRTRGHHAPKHMNVDGRRECQRLHDASFRRIFWACR